MEWLLIAIGLSIGIRLLLALTKFGLGRGAKDLELQQALQERMRRQNPVSLADECTALIKAGRKIEAIKHYRQHTGAGLAEAKAYIEALAAKPPDEEVG